MKLTVTVRPIIGVKLPSMRLDVIRAAVVATHFGKVLTTLYARLSFDDGLSVFLPEMPDTFENPPVKSSHNCEAEDKQDRIVKWVAICPHRLHDIHEYHVEFVSHLSIPVSPQGL